jgi:hypothetical protein
MDTVVAQMLLLGVVTIIIAAVLAVIWVGMSMAGVMANTAAQVVVANMHPSYMSGPMFFTQRDFEAPCPVTGNTRVLFGGADDTVTAAARLDRRDPNIHRYPADAAFIFLQANRNFIAGFRCEVCEDFYEGADIGSCLPGHSIVVPPLADNPGMTNRPTQITNKGYLVFSKRMTDEEPLDGTEMWYAIWIR